MKILFVCQYFPPESNAPAVRTYEHAREWVRAGHDVSVLTGYPNHPHGRIADGYRGEFVRRERIDGIEVIRTWIYATANRGVVRRSMGFGSFFASAVTLGRFQVERPDVVVGTSPQFLSAAAGYVLARSLGAPFVFELRDIWPESAVELGALRTPLAIRPLLSMQRHLYRNSAGIITVSEGFRPHLTAAGVGPDRIAYVPHGVAPELLAEDTVAPSEIRRELGIGDRFLVSYVGTHGMAHGLSTVLEAAVLLRDHPDVRLVFAGDGAERAGLERRAAELGLENVLILGQLDRNRALAITRASDLSLVPLRDLAMFRKVVPSKLFETLGSGIPVLMSVPEGEACRIVRESGGGVVISPEDAPAMAAAIRELSQDRQRCAALGATGRTYVLSNHLRTGTAQTMIEALERFIRPKSAPREVSVS